MEFASVIIFKKLGEFDDELTYQIPENLKPECFVGSFVEVPFRNKALKGMVTDIHSSLSSDLSADKIRFIDRVLPISPLHSNQIQLARFIARYYQTSMARALKLFLPKILWNGKLDPPTIKQYRLIQPDIDLRGDKQKQIVNVLQQSGGVMSFDDLKRMVEKSSTTLNSLVKKGVIEEMMEPVFKPFALNHLSKVSDKVLNSDQKKVFEKIKALQKPALLHGVTSSGKTEIYLRAILNTIQSGKQAILLVPEIALTPQTVQYFKDFLGDHIALFHSQLTDGQRLIEWWKVKNGHCPLIIGSRSAIFAPVENCGLIILDEEHEWTYKQESNPYYQTHRVAEEMAQQWGATLIFGSATPSAESFLKAKEGDFAYLQLPQRIHGNDFPLIKIVDLRDEFKKRNFSVFSLTLQNKIRERLENKEQIILFVNQRGLANAVVCRDCGYTEKCPHCDISLKFHRNFAVRNSRLDNFVVRNSRLETHNNHRASSYDNRNLDRLVCHYCNYSKAPELLCPECRSPYIKHVGVGTQRVEEETKRLFPEARVVRADRDTTQIKDGFASIYHDFLAHKHDVLIGTQMVAKGLDFSKVSLIGIVLADIGLHIPDFRSSERLFQILTQVAGRCGRRETPGEVILQTYNPDHPTLKKAAEYRYEDFIKTELKEREAFGYPPFNRMIKFTVVGFDQQKLSAHIQQESEVLSDIFKVNDLDVKIVSAPALISKMANRYYYHVLLRSKDPTIIFKHWKPPKGWRIDVDPIHTT